MAFTVIKSDSTGYRPLNQLSKVFAMLPVSRRASSRQYDSTRSTATQQRWTPK